MLLCPWDFPGKSTGVGWHAHLQGIFPIQESDPGLLHCGQMFYLWATREALACYRKSKINQRQGGNICKIHECECISHSVVWLFVTPWTIAHQAPLSMELSRQEYWSRVPFPSPGDLPNPGIEPASPALQADSLPLSLFLTRKAL